MLMKLTQGINRNCIEMKCFSFQLVMILINCIAFEKEFELALIMKKKQKITLLLNHFLNIYLKDIFSKITFFFKLNHMIFKFNTTF